MRAIWKGHIQFSLVTIPVRIYNAVDTTEKISFNQLHKKDNGPVGYDKKCKQCHESLTADQIVKGYQYEPGQYVIIEQEDFEKIRLKSTKVIEILGFIDASEIHPTLYDAPYYAGPDGPVAAKAYGLLSQTLKDSNKLGVGKVVLRDREDIVMIAPHEGGIVLYKLRTPSEVRSMKDVPQLDTITIDKEQLKLARSLVDSMAKKLDEIELRDTYHVALREMIQAKIEGKEIVQAPEEVAEVVDIMAALKASIEQAKSARKPMKKATGESVKERAKKPAPKKTPVAKASVTKKRKVA